MNILHVLTLLVFSALGLLMIIASVLIPEAYWDGVAKALLRELGVVVFAVFCTSFIYERLIAERHFKKFVTLLRASVERGESNIANCESLGIERIFYNRNTFVHSVTFPNLLQFLTSAGKIRIAGKSCLTLFKEQEEAIVNALSRGISVEFCMLNPNCSKEELERVDDLAPNELGLARELFKIGIARRVMAETPSDNLRLCIHNQATIDSTTVRLRACLDSGTFLFTWA